MPDEGIGTKVSVLGDKEYKAALADIGRQLTVLNTNMAATQSAFDDQGDAMDALRSKSASLQSIYEVQARRSSSSASSWKRPNRTTAKTASRWITCKLP